MTVTSEAIQAGHDETVDATSTETAAAGQLAPTGAAAAALVAAGVGCAAFGLAVVAAEALTAVKQVMTLSEQVGPLSGKAITGMSVYALAWLLLHLVLRRRSPDLRRVIVWTGVLTGLGILATFPPVYGLLATGP